MELREADVDRAWDVDCNDYGVDCKGTRYRSFHPAHIFHHYAHAGIPRATVRLVVDPEGDLRGWVASPKDQPGVRGDGPIIMVEHKRIYEISFPAGSKAEEAAGTGHTYPLRVVVLG